MRKQKYVYNEQTLQFEKHKLSPTEKLLKALKTGFSIAVVSFLFFALAYKYFPTPKEQALEREKEVVTYHLDKISKDLSMMAQDLNALQEKDAEVHRMIFGIDPLDQAIWNGGIGGSSRYATLDNYQSTGKLIKETLSTADLLKRQMNLQKASLDTLYTLALEKENRLASIPSIKPIREDKLKRKLRSLSGYGIRMHPVHKVKKRHNGIDFTAPKGTPIQATGDGTVVRVEKKRKGYGNNVIIDHGYGYTSLYGHMHTISVKKGDKVKKGQEIGQVGSTGTSTAPHLHYEVRLHKKAVNPIDYCLDGLTPEEYKELVEKASVENQSFD